MNVTRISIDALTAERDIIAAGWRFDRNGYYMTSAAVIDERLYRHPGAPDGCIAFLATGDVMLHGADLSCPVWWKTIDIIRRCAIGVGR